MKRHTRQREAILRFLRGTFTHPTADQIYEELRRELPNISKGTVYRNLKVLKEMDLVTELNLNGTVNRFEAKLQDHYHFRCQHCGRVFDVDLPVDRDLAHRASARTGFKIFHHQLEFRGLCHECQRK